MKAVREMENNKWVYIQSEPGLYTVGRYAWELTNLQVLQEPVAAKGQLSLWEWANNDEKKEA
ncbi:hypothetical protein [Lysinibacillus sp. LZ02]|uniref:hypothetical protein n=1 Tax=Lysinibacillus sp. LZ02 TaxID=3420668 RepID=UPI003D36710E